MDEEAFIEMIRNNEELYNKASRFYMDTKRKDAIWKQIGDQFKIDAKVKWGSIRDRYVREKKKQNLPSGSGANYKTTWCLFPSLQFLDDHIKPRKMKENVFPNGEHTEEHIVIMEDILESSPLDLIADSEVSLESYNSPATSSSCSNWNKSTNSLLNSSSSSRKRRAKEKEDEVSKLLVETLHQFSNKLKDVSTNNDEDWYFLQSIKCNMKKMNQEEKSKFKIEMLSKAEQAAKKSAI